MNLNKTRLFTGISGVALTLLLLIQVEWIFESAKVKEDLFNEKAAMVLSKTVQELCSDREICKRFASCNSKRGKKGCKIMLGAYESNRIDSLLRQSMAFYNFHMDYSFELISPNSIEKNLESEDKKSNIYKKRLEEIANKNGLELNLIFPDKKQFILAEMGTLFISSILLIVLILLLFRETLLSLRKEKMISEHTSDFLNNMAHEFKTPLTNISLAGKMMLRDTNIISGEKIKHYADIIQHENEKLRLQVEQVLGMTALERGQIPLAKSNTNIDEIINAALTRMNIQLESKDGNVSVELAAKNSDIFADKNQLINAFSNIIDNALKYAPGKPEIEIKTSNHDGKILIVITDKGTGIDKIYQKKVFDKFFRVPTGDIHNVKGFGLGLAYVKRIVELHDGTIELESEVNIHTTFKITLPHT